MTCLGESAGNSITGYPYIMGIGTLPVQPMGRP